jgi:hypothetical protein
VPYLLRMLKVSSIRRSGLVTGWVALLLLLLPALPAEAQRPAGVGVKVVSDGPTVSVETDQKGRLTAVLEEFCQDTRTTCEGTAAAGEIELPPTQVFGTWEQVVHQLMDGTRLNFVAMPPTTASGGRLVVIGPAVSSDATRQMVNAASQATCPPESSAGPAGQFPSNCAGGNSLGFGRQSEAPAPYAPTSSLQPPSTAATSDEATPSVTADSGFPAVSTASGDGSMQPLAGPASGAGLPFPDSQGQAISPSTEPPAFLPFPDSNGKPIAISNQPNPSPSMPFPDGRGNPIPASNQRPQYLPFPDSQGNPVPVR